MRTVRSLLVLAVSSLIVAALGCSGPVMPGPSPTPPPVAPPSPAPPALPAPPAADPDVNASLAIEHAAVIVRSAGSTSYLEPHFLLRETGGRSGATVHEVWLYRRGGDSGASASSCWRDTLRAPPAGLLDTFDTDAGWDWLGYCAPWVKDPVALTVVFADDGGRVGETSTPGCRSS